MKNRGAYQDASRFSFYCKVPFLVQEMETVRVVEVISELERIWTVSYTHLTLPTKLEV